MASSVQFGTLGVFLQQFRHFRCAASVQRCDDDMITLPMVRRCSSVPDR